MSRSDETSDEPGLTGSGSASGTDVAATGNRTSHVLRERIRRAGVAAAQAVPLEAPSAAPPHSSLPPEHSGVRARPNDFEPAATLPPPLVVPQPSAAGRQGGQAGQGARAWPFAPSGSPRTPVSTKIGLGEGLPEPEWAADKTRSRTPPLPTPAVHAPPARDSNAAMRGGAPTPSLNDLVTADTAPIPLPASLSTHRPPPPAGAGAEVPEIDMDTEAVLLDDSDSELTTSLDAQSAAILEEDEDVAVDSDKEPITTEVTSGDDNASRARRYTPKQRPAHRRSRPHDASRTTGPSRTKDERPARSHGDERSTLRSRPDELAADSSRDRPKGWRNGSDEAPVPHSPSGEHGPLLRSSMGNGALERENAAFEASPRRRDTRNERVRPRDDTSGRQALENRTTVPTTRLLTDGRSSEDPPKSKEPYDRAEIARTLPDRPALHATVPGRPPVVRGRPTPQLPIPRPPSPRPSTAEILPSVIVSPSGPARPSYEPLPRDRAGFEAFMRQRAAEAEANGSRPNWKEQETLLIPREALVEETSFGRNLLERLPLVLGALLAIALVAGATMWLKQRTTDTNAVRSIPISENASPAQPGAAGAEMTTIATEPSGAELLLGGAVLGNTPVEVTRPRHGDETYFLRMRGFESQLVRVSPHSGSAIRVMLLPASNSGQQSQGAAR